tara:strand:- start:124 stop:1251 length:1128 start_codon:yes stop_codon:yes gene_type:complete
MKFLIIPDKFKGSLSSSQVIDSLEKGIRRFDRSAKFKSVSISDGGDGFLASLNKILNLDEIKLMGRDSLMREIETSYLISKKNKTAYIELAKSCGVSSLKQEERNPLVTSTYGTGVEINHALKSGIKKLVIGLGGSSTNDLGLGIMSALGVKFLDKDEVNLIPNGSNLSKISTIIFDCDIKEKINNVEWEVINDVKNVTFGINGCAMVYASQKGASKKDIKYLEESGLKIHKLLINLFNKDYSKLKGSGAAGGTAYGLKLFTDCKFSNGIEFIFKKTDLDNFLLNEKYDYAITGEGQIDSQTLNGKAVESILKKLNKYKIPIIIVCGKNKINITQLSSYNVKSIISISSKDRIEDLVMKNASKYLEEDIYQYFKN